MVNRNQHGMGNCHLCTLWRTMSTDSHILRIEVGFLVFTASCAQVINVVHKRTFPFLVLPDFPFLVLSLSLRLNPA